MVPGGGRGVGDGWHGGVGAGVLRLRLGGFDQDQDYEVEVEFPIAIDIAVPIDFDLAIPTDLDPTTTTEVGPVVRVPFARTLLAGIAAYSGSTSCRTSVGKRCCAVCRGHSDAATTTGLPCRSSSSGSALRRASQASVSSSPSTQRACW